MCVCTAPLASAAALQPELNPTASLALFTTAAGFSESLSGSVRTEASLGKDTHLWARLSASRDEIEPVSSPNSKVTTDAGSIFVGAEGIIRKTRIGLAFATGKGRSRNKTSDAKNTFDWYGLSLYGRSVIGGFSLISDLSLSRVQNSLKTAGTKNKTNTDLDTASIGLEIQKTFSAGPLYLTPFVSADVLHIRGKGYETENGIQVSKSNVTLAEFPCGVHASLPFHLRSGSGYGMFITPVVSLAVIPTSGSSLTSQYRLGDTGNFSSQQIKVSDGTGKRATVGIHTQGRRSSFGLETVMQKDDLKTSYGVFLRGKYSF